MSRGIKQDIIQSFCAIFTMSYPLYRFMTQEETLRIKVFLPNGGLRIKSRFFFFVFHMRARKYFIYFIALVVKSV